MGAHKSDCQIDFNNFYAKRSMPATHHGELSILSLAAWKGTGILLDGHNRLEICARNKILFDHVYIYLPDRSGRCSWRSWLL